MASWRFPGWVDIAQATARALGWMTALAAMVIMGFTIHRWADTGSAVVPGLIGATVSLITDSWQMVALGEPSFGLEPMSATRTTMHDTFSLLFSLGSVVMIQLTKTRTSHDDISIDLYSGSTALSQSQVTCSLMLQASLWSLVFLILWRAIFTITVCWDFYRELQVMRIRIAQYGRPWV